MARSPGRNAGLVVSLHVAAGRKVLSDLAVLEVEITREVDRVPRARLAVRDGDPATGLFPASSRPELAPGATLTISAAYGGQAPTALFEGLVVRHGLEVAPGSARLVVELADPVVRLTASQASRVATGKSLADAFGPSIAAAKLPEPDYGPLAEAGEAVVQAGASDWDFLLAAARAAGAAVVVTDGTIVVAPPDPSAAPVLTVAYGDALQHLDVRADATELFGAATAPTRAWSYADQVMSEAAPTPAATESLGSAAFSAAKMERVMGAARRPLQTSATLAQGDLQHWADAALLRSRLTRLHGAATFQGDPTAAPGVTLELKGVGPGLSGPAWIRGVRHRLSAARWTTTAFLGLEPPPPPPSAPLGALPALRGLHAGKVRKLTGDPANQHRVFVNLPALKDKAPEEGVWARLAQPYASNGFGLVAFPEVDDEVLVAFMQEDPRTAVIVASLYSSGRPPPYPADAKNIKKALVTRSKMEVSFDDQDVVLQIKTPDGHTFTLSNKDKSVELKDVTGSKLTMDAKGMRLTSPKDIEIEADGKVTVTAKGALEMSGGPTATLKAQSTTLTGTSSLVAESKASGALKAVGELVVSGAMVRIN